MSESLSRKPNQTSKSLELPGRWKGCCVSPPSAWSLSGKHCFKKFSCLLRDPSVYHETRLFCAVSQASAPSGSCWGPHLCISPPNPRSRLDPHPRTLRRNLWTTFSLYPNSSDRICMRLELQTFLCVYGLTSPEEAAGPETCPPFIFSLKGETFESKYLEMAFLGIAWSGFIVSVGTSGQLVASPFYVA